MASRILPFIDRVYGPAIGASGCQVRLPARLFRNDQSAHNDLEHVINGGGQESGGISEPAIRLIERLIPLYEANALDPRIVGFGNARKLLKADQPDVGITNEHLREAIRYIKNVWDGTPLPGLRGAP